MVRLCSVDWLSVVPFMYRKVSSENSVIHAIEVKTWLDRAGSSPLSIDLCYTMYVDESTQDAWITLCNGFSLLHVYGRCFVLEICGPIRAGSTIIDSSLIQSSAKHPFRKGSRLLLQDVGNPMNIQQIKLVLWAMLQALHGRIANFRFSFFGGLFRNVRDLKLDWCTCYGDYLVIIYQSPDVEVLSVFLGMPAYPSTRITVRTLGKLLVLNVHAMLGGDDIIPELFDELCTPALRELTLYLSLDFSTLEPPLEPYLAQFLGYYTPFACSLDLTLML
ncbi:hypothetical protein BD410DRAFT_797448 [Rickenella mellea]|uniref:Uncharacterized protein n=1 Tax=Rickenella mellea TaxID=50990 RepID=A0A4Y7PFP9_9AGAM|nr:hypothetical protein BD410DRAFT_797448 [Rickenella mellea]